MPTAPPRSLLADCCSAFATTRPPSRPATRAWHVRADRLLAASRPQLVPLLAGLGLLASLVSNALPRSLGLLPVAAFFLIAGGWCTLNFARSFEAHCVLTGFGWDALGLVALAALVLGADWRSPLWAAFFGILALGVVFEVSWAMRRGSTAVRQR